MTSQNNLKTITRIDFEFLSSPQLQEMRKVTQSFAKLGQPPYEVVDKEGKKENFTSIESLRNHIVKVGESDLHIQRYKGLGEMNPEQLWETTMDPTIRSLQVQVDDAVAADNIFSILMEIKLNLAAISLSRTRSKLKVWIFSRWT